MFYSTMLFVFIAPVLFISFVKSTPVANDNTESCNIRFYSGNSCSGSISTPQGCKASTLNLGNSNTSACTSVRLFWNYPKNNLTMTIETPFTQKRQAYAIYLENEQVRWSISHLYRIFNGQETEITTDDDKVIQYSDANYQVILKFQAPPTLSAYGVFIDYQVDKL